MITTLIEKDDVYVFRDSFAKSIEELLNTKINDVNVTEDELIKSHERVVAVDQRIQTLSFVQEPLIETFLALTRVERKKKKKNKKFNRYIYYKEKGMEKRLEGFIKEYKIFKVIKSEFKNAKTNARFVYRDLVATVDILLDNKIIEVKTAKSIESALNEEYLTEIAIQNLLARKCGRMVDTYIIIYNTKIHVYRILFDPAKLQKLEEYIEKFSDFYDELKKIYNENGIVVISKETIDELELVNKHFISLVLNDKVYPLLRNKKEVYENMFHGSYEYFVIEKKDFYFTKFLNYKYNERMVVMQV